MRSYWLITAVTVLILLLTLWGAFVDICDFAMRPEPIPIGSVDVEPIDIGPRWLSFSDMTVRVECENGCECGLSGLNWERRYPSLIYSGFGTITITERFPGGITVTICTKSE